MEDRQGVCQDFAHVAIAGLRCMGLPARYVSGYIRTYADEEGETFRGADASHAWIDVWCGEDGWIGLDPTNNLIVQDEHITLAIGRDFGDVSPVSGMILGGGRQHLSVAVTVTPLK
jgi:transglutaminase-like putative cysteine protease